MPKINVITPVAPHHKHLLQRCQDSVAMQTMPCEHVVIVDHDYKGAGYARNRGIEKSVHADFVVFLDVDDTIEPTFVERCLDVHEPGAYVYTDWMRGNDIIQAPDKPWRADGSWHVITALIPTPAVIEADGFDETVIGGEDSLFYWTLTRAGCCGIHLPEPLFHYGHEGQRAKEFIHNERAYNHWKQTLLARFKHQMGCCGDNTPTPEWQPQGEPLPGDVLAIAIWAGNRQERGTVTGRLYERTGNGKQVWINPQDAAAAPHLWRVVTPAKDEPKRLHVNGGNGSAGSPQVGGAKSFTLPPTMHGVQEVARALYPNAQHTPDIEALASIEPVGRGDVGQVLRLARR